MAKKYIDAEAALTAIKVYCPANYEAEMLARIVCIPAADVVEVVRCKDCLHSYDSVGGLCCSHGICVDCVVQEDFYCASGAKREAEE